MVYGLGLGLGLAFYPLRVRLGDGIGVKFQKFLYHVAASVWRTFSEVRALVNLQCKVTES